MDGSITIASICYEEVLLLSELADHIIELTILRYSRLEKIVFKYFKLIIMKQSMS